MVNNFISSSNKLLNLIDQMSIKFYRKCVQQLKSAMHTYFIIFIQILCRYILHKLLFLWVVARKIQKESPTYWAW